MSIVTNLIVLILALGYSLGFTKPPVALEVTENSFFLFRRPLHKMSPKQSFQSNIRTDRLPLWDAQNRYNGQWVQGGINKTPFGEKFNEDQGDIYFQFVQVNNNKYMLFRWLDGKYVDQYYGITEWDLTKIIPVNGIWTFPRAPQNFTIANHLGNTYEQYECDTTGLLNLTNKITGVPWNENNKDLQNLNINLSWESSNPNCTFSMKTEMTLEASNIWMPLAYVGAIAAGAGMNILSAYLLLKEDNQYFLYSISPASIGIMLCLDFQYFGFNMLLGLAMESIYFEYLTLASIALFFGVLVKMRVAFIAVRIQNANNPNIAERTCANPVIAYAIKCLISLSVFYILSFFIMVYRWYTYYLIPFYLFPIFQIWMSAVIGNRKVFKWQYQLLLWPPTLIIPVFMRGYDNNFLQLTPNIEINAIVLPAMIGVFILYSMMQGVCGPRFFLLGIFFPAPHKYMIAVKKLKKDREGLEEEELVCPICYGELDEDPEATVRNTATDPNNPGGDAARALVAKPIKKCMVTPCKHYYHPSCLKQWMDQKMECPTCRQELPPY
jgi:hypothetical protein